MVTSVAVTNNIFQTKQKKACSVVALNDWHFGPKKAMTTKTTKKNKTNKPYRHG